MILKSFAKINSILYVIGKRSDGYHDIYTVMHKIDLYDWISIEKSADSIAVKMDKGGIQERENIAFKAAELFFKKSNIKPQVSIEIEKHIPIGGGLGGGSSNAAYTLLGLNELFDFPLTDIDLFEIGQKLGSDVPFFLVRGSALATGRGEKVYPIRCNTEGFKVFLVKPNFGVSTGEIYKKFRLTNKKPLNKMAFTVKDGCKIENLIPHLHNDLESVVLSEFDLLKEIKEKMVESFGCGLISGSGSTLFSIIGSEVVRKDELKEFWLSKGYFCKIVDFAE